METIHKKLLDFALLGTNDIFPAISVKKAPRQSPMSLVKRKTMITNQLNLFRES